MSGYSTDLHRPVIEREDGTWRALQKGVPVEPSLVSFRAELAD